MRELLAECVRSVVAWSKPGTALSFHIDDTSGEVPDDLLVDGTRVRQVGVELLWQQLPLQHLLYRRR